MKQFAKWLESVKDSPVFVHAENMIGVTEAFYEECLNRDVCYESGELDYHRLSELTGLSRRRLKRIFTLDEKARVYDLFILAASLGKKLRLILED